MAQLTVTVSANDRASAVLQKVQQATAKTHSALESLNSAGSGLSGASSSIKSLNNESSKSPGIFSKMGSALKKTLTIVGGFTVVRGIFDTISSSIGTAISRLDTFDVFERKMKLITGSTEDAKYALEEMTEATTGTAYKLDTAAQSVQNFVTRGMNTKDAVASIKIWMDATSAYGAGTSDQFETVADAIAKMRTKGTVEMRQLNRLFQVGINPVRMYAQAVGMAEADVQEALTHKDIKAEEFLNVVETAMREGTNGVTIVEGMAQKVGTTWAATMTNSRIAVARGVANVIDAVNESFKVIDPDNGLKGIILNMGKSLEGALKTIAEKVKVFLPPIIERLGHLFDFVKQNGTLLITFFGSIAGIVGGFGAFKTASDCINDFRIAWSKLAQAFAKTNVGEALVGEVTSMKKVLTALPAATESALTVSEATPQQLVAETPYKPTSRPSTAVVTPPMRPVTEYIKSPVATEVQESVSAPELKQNPVTKFVNANRSEKSVQAAKNINTGEVYDPGNFTLVSERERRQKSGAVERLERTSDLGNLKNELDEIYNGTYDDFEYIMPGSTVIPQVNKQKNLSLEAGKSAEPLMLTGEVAQARQRRKIPTFSEYKASQPYKPTKIPTFQEYQEANQPTLSETVAGAWSQAKKPYKEKHQDLSLKQKKKGRSLTERVTSFVNPNNLTAGEKVAEAVDNAKPKSFGSAMKGGTQNFVKTAGNALEGGLSFVGKLIPDGLFEGAIEKVTGFKDSLVGVFTTMGAGLKTMFASMIGDFMGFGSSINGVITNFLGEGVVQSFTSFFANLVGVCTSFIGAIPQLVTGVAAFSLVFAGLGKINENGEAANGVAAFLASLRAQASNLLVVGQEWIGNLIRGIVTDMPTLVQRGVELVTVTMNGIAITLPQLISIGAQLLINFITGIITTIPTLVSTGFQAIQGFIQGLGTAIPTLIEQGWQMILTIGQSIANNLPAIFEAGKNTIQNLVQGIKDTLPILVENAWNIITTMADQFVQNLPRILEIGGQIITNLANGIAQLLPVLLTAGADLMVWLITTIVQHLPDMLSAGWQLITTLANGLMNALPTIISTAGTILGNIGTAIANFGTEMWNKALEIGTNLINGLKQGIEDTWNGAKEAVGGVFTGVIDWAKQILGVHSPSTEMITVGGYLIAGLDQGIQETMPQIIANMGAMLDQMVNDSRTKVQNMATTIQINYQELEANLNAQLESMTNTMNARWQALVNNSIQIMSQFNTSLITCLDAILNASNGKWEQVSAGMQSIVSRMTSDTQKQIQGLVDSIHNIMDELPNYTNQLGMDMMGQLAKGIDSTSATVTTTASDLVEKLKTVFETGLGIHSPSRFMEWVGQMMLEGLMRGMSQSQIQAFVRSTIEDMKASFANGKFNADELVDYMGDKTMDVVKYLEVIGDTTVSEAIGGSATGTPAIIQEAMNYVGYKSPGGHGGSMFGARYGNGGAWCASFVRYCADNVGVPFPPTNYVPDVVAWAQANGRSTQTPQPGYAAIFGGGSHIELVAGVSPDGTVDMIGGNTGAGEVKHRPRSDATSYVALDGGHSVLTLKDTILQAYNKKMGIFSAGMDLSPDQLASAMGTDGSGLLNPVWFQQWQPSQAVARWADEVSAVLNMLGEPQSLLKGVLWAINGESGGDPNSTYLLDENIVYGGSKGLLQTITPNFERWKNPSLPDDIYNPMQNIWCCLREMQETYGGIAALINRKIARGRWSGYAVGTRYVPQDMMAPIHKGEAILPASMNPYTQSGGDYLRDLVTGMIPSGIGNFDIEAIAQSENPSIDFDLGAVSGTGSTNNSQNYDNRNITLNNNYNIDTEAQARLNAHEMERVLHGILNQGIAVGRKGY